MSYKLTLTEDDRRTIAFIGDRYSWSHWAVRKLVEGDNVLAEHEAWEFKEQIDADTVGGHSPFPMLAEDSELHGKLIQFVESIV